MIIIPVRFVACPRHIHMVGEAPQLGEVNRLSSKLLIKHFETAQSVPEQQQEKKNHYQ